MVMNDVEGVLAIRMGDWKLVAKDGPKGDWELYNLKLDRCEMNNLSKKYPDKVTQLTQQWEAVAAGFRQDLTGFGTDS